MKHNDVKIPFGNNEKNYKCNSCDPFNHRHTGRLSIINDPECKKRVIAISDYYTQFTLKPIHNSLMKLLSSMPCDRTYTQDPFHN
jgi:hypothetical protein